MQHIRIEKFGPIKEIDIDLNEDIELIIGPQASGKSTFSKSIYFCKKIRDYFFQYLDSIINTETDYTDELYTRFLKFIRRPFMGYFGTTKHMDDFEIMYYYDIKEDKYVKVSLDKDHFAKFAFSPEMKKQLCDMIRETVEISKLSNKLSLSQMYVKQTGFMERIRQTVNEIFCDEDQLMYIPAGRNLLAVIPESFTKGIKSGQEHEATDLEIDIRQIDWITQEFIQSIREMKSQFGGRLEEITENYLKTVKGQIRNHDVELACNLIRDILKADYVCDKDGEKLFYDKEHWVKLMFGSSGQQEIVWALNSIFLTILKNEKTFIVFEEPESHLFPDSQLVLAELAALTVNSSKSRIIITTHSPYILTAMNLLLYSGEKEGKQNSEKDVIRKEYRLKPQKVKAYLLSRNTGKLESITGEEIGLVDAMKIDGVSDKIDDAMDRILQNSMRKQEKV